MSAKVIGLKELLAGFDRVQRNVATEGRGFMDKLGAWTVKRVQSNTEAAGAIDLGELHGGIHHVTKKTARGFETTVRPSDKADKYAIYVEEGTEPHWPPIDAITPWAERHGIPAFLVARKIAQEGTDPRYMWRDAYSDLEGEIGGRLSGLATDLLRGL